MAPYKYLKNVIAAQKATNAILVREKPVVGVKCHGVDMGPNGRITLVSMATWDGDVYVFDVKVCPDIMYSGGLLRLFQSAELLKVFHDCSRDSATLFHQFGVRLVNYFDTQIAYSVVMEKRGLSPRRVPLKHLCDEFQIKTYSPSPELQRRLAEDPNVWGLRPCTVDMLNQAASAVLPLVPTVFTETDSRLPEETDEWFNHLSEENRLSLIKRTKTGRKSKTKCPKNRYPTTSVHLVPVTEELHFCL